MAQEQSEPARVVLMVADVAVRVGRRVWGTLPAGLKKGLEDRAFYVIFQKTRVENDAYGWRPPPDSGGGGLPESPPAAGAPPDARE